MARSNPRDINFEPLESAVRRAGHVISGYFGQQLELTHKSSTADFRTRADVEAERVILDAIERYFAGTNIIAEEHGNHDRGSSLTWVVDPLDGTNNFVLGIPAFTTSVALLDGGQLVYGLIHHPVTSDTYTATKGGGAFKNGKPIATSGVSDLAHATVSYTCEYTTPKPRRVAFKSAMVALDARRFLDLWSPAFCYAALADGRLEAIINDDANLYDFAAGKLIVAEAGGRITDFSGRPISNDRETVFVASNGSTIHDHLVETITLPLSDPSG
jgi:myo-inositol-1(or 4)-monophosphatase